MDKIKNLIKQKYSVISISSVFLLIFGLLISGIDAIPSIISYTLMLPGVIGLLAIIIFEPGRLKSLFGSKQVKKGLQLSATLFLIFGILVLVYYIASRNKIFRIDTTSNKRFSLARQTMDVIKGVKVPVKILVFKTEKIGFTTQTVLYAIERAKSLVKEFSLENRNFSYEIVDAHAQPGLVSRYKIRHVGSIVIQYGKKYKLLEPGDYMKFRMMGPKRRPVRFPYVEQAITSSLITMVSSKQFNIYFTLGHSEQDIDNSSQNGASKLKDYMTQDGFNVKKINIVINKKIPADCDLLVLAGPKDNFSDMEIKAIEKYLNSGKPAIFMAERESSASYKSFLSRWGVDLKNNVVIDPKNNYRNMFSASPLMIIPDQGYHKITKPIIEAKRNVCLVVATSMNKSKLTKVRTGKKGNLITSPFNLTSLLRTSKEAWEENSDIKKVRQVERAKGEKKGVLDVAYAVIRSAEKTKLEKGKLIVTQKGPKKRLRYIVFGDSDFINNSHIDIYANKDLILNSVNWVLGQSKHITIRPRDPVAHPLELTAASLNVLKYMSKILPLLLIIGIGSVVYFKRRKNG